MYHDHSAIMEPPFVYNSDVHITHQKTALAPMQLDQTLN